MTEYTGPCKMDCPEKCDVPAGVRLVEMPPSRHNWSDIIRCPNDGCGRTLLVAESAPARAAEPDDYTDSNGITATGLHDEPAESAPVADDAPGRLRCGAEDPALRPVIDREALRARLWKIWQNPKESPADYATEWTNAVMELARSEAEVKAEALREAADVWAPERDQSNWRRWLRERADEMERR